jgi:gliding motility-associated-like protein
MKKRTNTFTLCTLLCIFGLSALQAQLTPQVQYQNAQSLNDLERIVTEDFISNDCFEVFNVRLNKGNVGNNASIGTFSNGTFALGMEEGIVLGTAPIGNFMGGNVSTSTGGNSGVPGTDGDLVNIDIFYGNPMPVPVRDMTTLEFDFIPTSETVSFRYVFASEEYCDYVGSQFNDKFALFLGSDTDPIITQNTFFIDGGLNKINLAEFDDQEPGPGFGQKINVAINNINYTTNSHLYVDNTLPEQHTAAIGDCVAATGEMSPYLNSFTFDGYTVPLEARYDNLQICEQYTMKIIVADGVDQIFGSAVFLQGRSFNAAQGAGVTDITFNDTGETYTYESCGDSVATVEFTRQEIEGTDNFADIDMPIEISTGGQFATYGLDYCTGLPLIGTVSVPFGGFFEEIVVKADDQEEGTEIIEIAIQNPCFCEPEVYTLEIIDVPPMEVRPLEGDTSCIGINRDLRAVVEGGGFPSVDRADPPAEFDYIWTDTSGTIISNEDIATVDLTAQGTYTYFLEVSDGCGGLHRDTVTFVTNGIPDADLEGDYSICDESPTAVLDFSFDGGVPVTVEYTLDGVPQAPITITDPDFQFVASEIGEYEITRIDGVNCGRDVEGIAVVSNQSFDLDVMPTPTLCSDSEDGMLIAVVSAGMGEYDYLWSDADGQETEMATGLAPGDYTVTVTDMLGCTQEFTQTVEAAPAVEVTPSLVSGTTCADPNSGEASASGNGGTGTFTYIWLDGGGMSVGAGETIAGLASGDYTVQIEDENGCQTTENINIPSDVNTPDAIAQNAVIDCNNMTVSIDTDGTSTGTEFEYAWTVNTGGGSVDSDPDAPLATISDPGSYTLTVTNTTNGCTATAPFEVVDLRVDPIADAGTGFDCITDAVQLGGPNMETGDDITYQWTSISGGAIQSATDIENPTVSEPGIYEVTVVNQMTGCESTAMVEVTVTPEVNIEPASSIDCRGDGTVALSGEGSSTDDVTYAWTASNGGAIVSGANSLNPIVSEAGTYTLTVSNTAGCNIDMPIQVEDIRTDLISDPGQPAQIDCNVSSINLGGPNTSTGGNITYDWTIVTDGGTSSEATQNITATAPGTYTLLVTNNDNGCTAVNEVTITDDLDDPIVNIDAPVTLTCENDSLVLTASGSSSAGNFSYTWTTTDGSIISDPNSQTTTIDDPGTYTLTIVNNDNGCEEFATVQVIEDAVFPNVVIAMPDNIDCTNTQATLDGSASDSGAGIDYTWFNQQNEVVGTGPVIVVDAAGEYTLEVNNTNTGCTERDRQMVMDIREDPVADVGPAQVLNCETTLINLGGDNLSTGAEFDYQWTQVGVGGGVFSTNPNPPITNGGEYNLVVINTLNGCTATETITIPQNTEDPDININAPDVITCVAPTQTLSADGSSTGTEFEYLWTGPDGFTSTDLNPEISLSGDYVLVITNTTNSCSVTDNVTVDEDAEFPAIAIEDPAIVNCENTIIELSGLGSEEGNDIVYEWIASNGGVIEDDEDSLNPEISAAGTYSLTVSNTATGCSRTLEVEVTDDFEPPMAMVNEDLTFGCQDDILQISGEGSSTGANITYEWSATQGNISGASNALNSEIDQPGDYTLLVTNMENGCTAEASFTVIPDEALPEVVLEEPETLTCERDLVLIDASASDAGAGLVYVWTKDGDVFTPANEGSFETDEPGEYTLTITDTANGCVSAGTTVVDQIIDLPEVEAGEPIVLNCRDMMLNLDADGSSSGSEFTYSWTAMNGGNIVDGDDTDEPLVDEPGMYILTVTNIETGCQNTDEVLVSRDNVEPVIELQEIATLNCRDQAITIDATDSDGGADYEINWTAMGTANIDSGEETLSPTVDEPGTYILTIVDTRNFCESTIEVEVEQDVEEPLAVIFPADILTCADQTVELLGSAGGSSAGNEFSYTWTNTSQTGSFAGATDGIDVVVDQPGTYELLVINTENFCEANFSIDVMQNVVTPTAMTGEAQEVTCENLEATLNGAGSSTGPEFTYDWSPMGSGVIVSGDNTLTPIVNAPGEYVLTVTNNENGCTETSVQSVTSNDVFPQDAPPVPVVLNCEITEQILAGTGNTGLSYDWSTDDGNIIGLATNSEILIDEPGTYVMTITSLDNGCQTPYEITVSEDVEDPVVDAGPTSLLNCTETVVALLGDGSEGPNFSYEWTTTDGALSGDIDDLEAFAVAGGTYTLTIVNTDNMCVSSDDVTIGVDENVPTGIDAEAISPNCFGDPGAIDFVGIDGGVGPFDYSIDGGATFSDETLFSNLTPGETYALLITDDNGCVLEQEITIPTVDSLAVQITEPFVEIELGESFDILSFTTIPENEIASITWTPSTGLSCDDCLNPEVTPSNNINYNVVVVSENGCVDDASIEFRVDRNIDIYIPNAFSPHNLDGINDLFAPLGKPNLIATVREFQIFDRWGNQVYQDGDFELNAIGKGWNGVFRNEDLQAGVYVYYVIIEFVDGSTELYEGDVTLMN